MQTSELLKILDPEIINANGQQDMPIYVRARTGMTYPVHYILPYDGAVKLLVLRTHTDLSVKAPAQITRSALRQFIGRLDSAYLDGNVEFTVPIKDKPYDIAIASINDGGCVVSPEGSIILRETGIVEMGKKGHHEAVQLSPEELLKKDIETRISPERYDQLSKWIFEHPANHDSPFLNDLIRFARQLVLQNKSLKCALKEYSKGGN
jgi:hypothetical protein